MSKKPDYTQSPALAFISAAGDPRTLEAEQDLTGEQLPSVHAAGEPPKPEGMKLNPEYIEKYVEKRTKRVQLVFEPSVYKAAKDRAAELNTSLNDYLHRLIKADLQNKPNTDNSTKANDD